MKTLSDYLTLVDRYKRPGCATNDYLQREAEGLIARGSLSACCGKDNAFLFVRKPVGQRLYYYLNDDAECLSVPADDCVSEILFRGDAMPVREINYLKRVGLSENVIRDNYAVAAKDAIVDLEKKSSITIRFAETVDEVRSVCELFNGSFDALSGDYVAEDQYEGLLSSRAILIALTESGTFSGALQQNPEGATSWVSHIAVVSSSRGLGVGNALMTDFFRYNMRNGVRRFACWVQRQNAPAVSMYKKFGFKYIGKSTLSMIKTK